MLGKSILLALSLGSLLMLAGCGGGGASSDTSVKNTTVSKGQALIDLKKAYDSGAMSKSEYEDAREKVLKE